MTSEFEGALGSALAPFVGSRVREIGAKVAIPLSKSKSYAANVMRRLIDSFPDSINMAACDHRGIEVKTVRKPRDARPYEAMSFPAFEPNELITESWQTSTLRKQLQRLLLLVLHAPERGTPPGSAAFGAFYFVSPSAEDWIVLEREWTEMRNMISGGRALALPKGSDTRLLHVRTHGRNKRDTTHAPGVGAIPRRSFWLNQDYVVTLIRRSRLGP